MTISAHRKVVTVLFCDVVGSTALGESVDPEALQGLLGRYFERMKGIVESHGGSVEKFIGDAVMAVFGVPVALRGRRVAGLPGAVEMHECRSHSARVHLRRRLRQRRGCVHGQESRRHHVAHGRHLRGSDLFHRVIRVGRVHRSGA